MEIIKTKLERMIYRKADSGWCIVKIQHGTAKGVIGWDAKDGELLKLEGEWKKSAYNGSNEFNFKAAMPDIPEDLLHLRSMFAMGALLMFSIHASEMPGMKNAKSRETVLREMIGYVTAGLKSRPVVPSSARPRLPIPPKPLKR